MEVFIKCEKNFKRFAQNKLYKEMAKLNDPTNNAGKNNSREPNISPSELGINYIQYEPAQQAPPQPRMQVNSMDPMRGNEFREILNTAIQAIQPERQIQHQPEVLGRLTMVIRIHA